MQLSADGDPLVLVPAPSLTAWGGRPKGALAGGRGFRVEVGPPDDGMWSGPAEAGEDSRRVSL